MDLDNEYCAQGIFEINLGGTAGSIDWIFCRDTMSEFRNFQSVLEDLHKHAQNLGEHERNSPDVLEKLSQ